MLRGLGSIWALHGLAGDLEVSQFKELSDYAENLSTRIMQLPDGQAKTSFLATLSPVVNNIAQIQSKRDFDNYPALFANEYKTNMQVLQYLDQQLAARTAEPTVVPTPPPQPAQTVSPFTPSGGSRPIDATPNLWMTPTVVASAGYDGSGGVSTGMPDSSTISKTFLILLAVGAVGFLVFKYGGKRK